MSSDDLKSLERDVEEARNRVLQDIVALRSPGAVAGLKRDVSEQIGRTKDEWIGSARDAATSEVHGMLDGFKSRALANPLAVLAIGAGIGWKLKNHPPIMSALVGLGIYGLMRADPARPARSVTWTRDTSRAVGAAARDWRDSDTAAELADYAEEARARADHYRGQAAELAGQAGDRVEDAYEAASAKAAEWSAEASHAAERAAAYGRRLARDASEAAHDALDRGRHVAEEAGDAVHRAYRYGRRRVHRAGEAGERYYHELADRTDRDKILLGAAAVAIAAAVGMAARNRLED